MQSRFKIELDFLSEYIKVYVDGELVAKADFRDVNQLMDIINKTYNIGFEQGKKCLDYEHD